MEGQHVFEGRALDLSTMFGVAVAFALVMTAIFMGGNPNGFVDIKSILIVVFGTLAVTVACYSFSEMAHVPATLLHTIFYRSEDIGNTAMRAMELAEIARKHGILELEKYEDLTQHNAFLKDGIRMVADNTPTGEIEKVLDYEMSSMLDRHSKSISILRKAAEVSPAMGLIGTLIGLVQMLGNLEDSSAIGPAMAVALLTTFYGAVLSYMVFSPLAAKLERNTQDEVLVANVYIQAVLSITKKENPRNLELVINSILPPAKRISYFALKRDHARRDMQELLDITGASQNTEEKKEE